MASPETLDKLEDILVEALGVEKNEVVPSALIGQDLGAESIDGLDINFKIEKEFDIQIGEGEVGKSLTDKALTARVERQSPHLSVSKKLLDDIRSSSGASIQYRKVYELAQYIEDKVRKISEKANPQ